MPIGRDAVGIDGTGCQHNAGSAIRLVWTRRQHSSTLTRRGLRRQTPSSRSDSPHGATIASRPSSVRCTATAVAVSGQVATPSAVLASGGTPSRSNVGTTGAQRPGSWRPSARLAVAIPACLRRPGHARGADHGVRKRDVDVFTRLGWKVQWSWSQTRSRSAPAPTLQSGAPQERAACSTAMNHSEALTSRSRRAAWGWSAWRPIVWVR